MLARLTLLVRNGQTRPVPVCGGLLVAGLLGLSCLPGCRAPAPGESVIEPSAPFSRPVATLGPDDAVSNGTDGDAAAAVVLTPPAPASAGQMKQALDATGKVALQVDFDTDSTHLRADAAPVLDEIASLLRNDPALKLSIDAHTDARGSAERNRTLTQQRAEVLRAALIAEGIDADRLLARGHGSDRPVANSSSVDSRRNRRVELVRLD